MEELRQRYDSGAAPIVVSGCIGPQDDGYSPQTRLSAADAQEYHATQIGTFASTTADMVCAITMTYADEAVGITRAARDAALPAAISFTLETDGRLPSGQALGDAIVQVDRETDGGAAQFMINCAHPVHFADVLAAGGDWRGRIGGLRANASMLSHAELDAAEELDDGDPADLAARYVALRELLPNLTLVGGCCGTDVRHVTAICDAWLAEPPETSTSLPPR
jgi:homocysteine S-methyltransferase